MKALYPGVSEKKRVSSPVFFVKGKTGERKRRSSNIEHSTFNIQLKVGV
jgi:hypothetical protein